MDNLAQFEMVETIYGQFYTWKNDLITDQLKKYSAHARNELAMIKSIISPDDTVLDIGAHIGTFSIPIAHIIDEGSVYSFEANSDNYTLLNRNIELNELSEKIITFNKVVSIESDQRFSRVVPNDSNSGMSYFVKDGESEFSSINIDEWFKNSGLREINFLKIDVEGAELDVLRSSEEIIKRFKPILYIEVCNDQLGRFSNSVKELEDFLINMGYCFFKNTGKRNSSNDNFRLESINTLAEGGYLFDVLAVHKSSKKIEIVRSNVKRSIHHKEEGVEKIENLFLSVGAMKAGTTWLYEQLKNHPEIHFSPEKEVHYFANMVGIENQLNHRNRIIKLKGVLERTAHGNPKFISNHLNEISWYSEYARPDVISNEWYQYLFRFNQGRKYCADFSNLYCQMGKDGWENVRKVAKNIKVIYTLRDPLERLWSHYKFHMKWVNREDEALDAGFEHFKNLLDQHFFWVNAEYTKNYELLQQSLNGDELMLLYFEDFRERPEEMLSKVQKFLGIEEISADPEKLNKKVNKTKSFDMPDEWRKYTILKLKGELEKLNKSNISHKKWCENEQN